MSRVIVLHAPSPGHGTPEWERGLLQRLPYARRLELQSRDPESRRESMALAHQIRETIGRLHKVLPTAVLAAALKPSITRRELEARAEAIVETIRAGGGNMGVTSGRQAIEEGAEPLAARNIIHVERGGRFRVRERTVPIGQSMTSAISS